ncbi:hypothetical protein [Gemmiger formicilis]|uniref:hypothetical protein n=1 Tax=Gemmiger formicilis TaxID=745368 RepID=UPI0030776868
MACVFATSAFAADFSNADTAAKAKAEIKAFAASYGITTIDNTVNSLTAAQLQVIYNNMNDLKATAASANATIKGTTDVAVATKAANDAVATMNSLLPAGVSISAPTIDTSDSSKLVVFADVTANNAKDTVAVVAVVAEVPTTTTDNNTNTSAAVSNAAKNSAAASSVKTVSSAANPITASSSAVIKTTGDNTAVVFAVAALAVAGVLGMAVRKERAL